MVPRMRAQLRALMITASYAPQRFPVGPKGIRRALLRRFPYMILFRATDDAIHIIAVFHTSRDPVRWQRRT